MTDLSRAFVSDIEVRADSTGRTVHGIVVPFGRVARVSDGGPSYEEGFRRGAFKRTIDRGAVSRVKLLSHHSMRTNPLGRALVLREDEAGLYGEFRVSQTAAGDEALELVRDGALDSFSVGFSPIQQDKKDGVVWRTEVGIREASLVTFPAYEGALIGGVRMEDLALETLVERVAALELRSAASAAAVGTSNLEPAHVEQDSAPALRSTHQAVLAYRRGLRERGIRT